MCSRGWGAEHMNKARRSWSRNKGPRLRSRGAQDLSCRCPVPPLCDLIFNVFLTFQLHLSASPTQPLLCALSIPGWLSQLVVSLMPPCLQTPPGAHLLPSPSPSLPCTNSSHCLQESHQALPRLWGLSSLPRLHFAFIASLPLHSFPLYRCPIWQLIYVHICFLISTGYGESKTTYLLSCT